MEIQRVVGEEIKDQSNVRNRAPKNHALGRLLVSNQTIAYACNQRNFLSKPQYFACLGHTDSQLAQSSDEIVVVSSFGLHSRNQTHNGILYNSAAFVSANP